MKNLALIMGVAMILSSGQLFASTVNCSSRSKVDRMPVAKYDHLKPSSNKVYQKRTPIRKQVPTKAADGVVGRRS